MPSPGTLLAQPQARMPGVPSRHGGFGLAAASALLFGLVGVISRLSPWPPLWKAGTAYLLAGILLAPSLRGIAWRRSDFWRFASMTAAGGIVGPALFFLALEISPTSDVALLVTAEMVFTGVLAAIFLRERLSVHAWAGLALLLACAMIVAGRPSDNRHSWLGAALALLATFGWAIDNVVSTPLTRRYPARAIIGVKALAAGIVVPLALLATGPVPPFTSGALLSLAYTGTLGLGASATCFYAAIPRIGPTFVSAIQLPGSAVVGAIAAWIFLHDKLGAAHVAAVVLLVGGAILLAVGPAVHASHVP